MRGHKYTIDRWDDATGENLLEEIRGRGVRVLLLSARTFGFGGHAALK